MSWRLPWRAFMPISRRLRTIRATTYWQPDIEPRRGTGASRAAFVLQRFQSIPSLSLALLPYRWPCFPIVGHLKAPPFSYAWASSVGGPTRAPNALPKLHGRKRSHKALSAPSAVFRCLYRARPVASRTRPPPSSAAVVASRSRRRLLPRH